MGDIVLGEIISEKRPLVLSSLDRFGHMMIAGPTGCGKTSKIIKPCIWQDLMEIKEKRIKWERMILEQRIIHRDKVSAIEKKHQEAEASLLSADNLDEETKRKALGTLHKARDKEIEDMLAKTTDKLNRQEYIAGLTVVEPKGDLAIDVVKMCKALDLPYTYINPMDESTHKFNIMEGEADIVAESTRTVLRNLFGKQEPFFAQVQETTARNTVLLMKRLRGDNIDIIDIARVLRTQAVLQKHVDEYKAKTSDQDDLVQFYDAEVFGVLQDRFYQFAMGLRQQLEDIGFNKYLQRVLIGKSDVNLDTHLEEGGILIVNTAMGELGKLGDVFGQFVVMYLQNAVFRRAGTEFTRPYHYLWIDEAPRYLNPDFERLLAIGRSYRCATTLAIQTLDQLKLEEKEAFAGVVLSNCRSKVVFGGLPAEDCKEFESEFGSDMKRIKQHTYNYRKINPAPPLLPKSFRTTKQDEVRYTFTQIKELRSERKKAEALVQYTDQGALQQPVKIMTHVGDYQKTKQLRLKEMTLVEYRKAAAEGRTITLTDDMKLIAQIGAEVFLPKWAKFALPNKMKYNAPAKDAEPVPPPPFCPVQEEDDEKQVSEQSAVFNFHTGEMLGGLWEEETSQPEPSPPKKPEDPAPPGAPEERSKSIQEETETAKKPTIQIIGGITIEDAGTGEKETHFF